MGRFYITFILFCCCQIIFSQTWQNIIPNYSFENHDLTGWNAGYKNSNLFKKLDIQDSIKSTKKHQIFGEVLGAGGYYSLGYERIFLNFERFELSASIGFTNIHFTKPKFSFGFPLSVNSRIKFLNFNGVDFGLTVGNFINVWSMIDQDKYFNCPTGVCIPPIRILPSFHAGWVFRLNKFTISPRFYGFLYTSSNIPKVEPYFGLRGYYSF